MLNDLRYAVRMGFKNPGSTAVAVLTLAIAIGATTAIYSAVQATILDPLPVTEADRLQSLESFNAKEGRSGWGVSLNTIAALQERPEAFAQIAVWDGMLVKYRGKESIELIRGAEVSPNFFALWGVQPILGRVFATDEGKASRVVVLSHGFWRTRLGGDPQIIGKSVELEPESESSSQRYTVIGVMPKHFVFPEEDVDYWIPTDDRKMDRSFRNLDVFVRLATRATLPQAQAILDVIAARQAADDAAANEGWQMRLRPVSAMFADEVTRQKLWTLLAGIGFVWLIACANVANLLLARAEARQHEMATRAALGAGRGRLARQLLTESLLLAMAGGLGGLLLTQWGIGTLSVFLGGIRLKALVLDEAVLFSALALSGVTGLVFGLAPAWQASRPCLVETLKRTGSSSTQAASGRWLLRGLIVAEIAFAVVILTGAGLMIRSVVHVFQLHVGYDSQNLWMAVAIPPTKEEFAYAAFIRRLGEEYAQLPGVKSVGIRTIGSRRKYVGEGDDRAVEVRHEGTGLDERNLFAALRVPLLEGRFLERSDLERRTVVVNQTLARTLWPGEKAVGKRLRAVPGQDRTGGPRILQEGVLEVVGVVGDARLDDHEANPRPTLYRPCQEFYRNLRYDMFYLRTTLDPAAAIRSIHAAINQADPGVIHRTIQNVSEELYRSTQGRRFFTLYLTLYAAVGLALAAIGLYGLMAFSVQRRTREFGIRIALGSTSEGVILLVMKDGLRLALIGLAIGLTGALVSAPLLQSQLYGVSPRDPVTLAVLTLVLLAAAGTASFLPAHRATKIDPMQALRHE